MLTVHHLDDSRSQRILWLLEELAIPYEIRFHKRDPATMMAPAALKAVHPLGKSPVIEDGGVVVAESGAIVEYLVDTHGKGRLKPRAGTPEARRYTYWLHYAEGSAMPPLLVALIFNKIEKTPVPFFVKPVVSTIVSQVRKAYIDPQLKTHMGWMEETLTASPWFAGEAFTAADVQMSFPVEALEARGGLDGRYPKLVDFLKRIRERPAYEKALERGGPYSLAF